MFLKSISWMLLLAPVTVVSNFQIPTESPFNARVNGSNAWDAFSRAEAAISQKEGLTSGKLDANSQIRFLGDSVTATLNQKTTSQLPRQLQKCEDEDDLWPNLTSGLIGFDTISMTRGGGFMFQTTASPIDVCVEVPIPRNLDIDPDSLEENLLPISVGTLR
jgi:hypothetical protein